MPLPIAHGAAGVAACLLLKKKENLGTPAEERRLLLLCVFLAVLPDLDFVPGLVLGDSGRFHHGGSHSIVTGLIAVFSAGLFCGRYFKAMGPVRCLLSLVTASLSHPLLDFFSVDMAEPYGVPMFWPFSAESHISSFSMFHRVERVDGTAGVFLASILTGENLRAVWGELFFSASLLFLVSSAGPKKWVKLLLGGFCFCCFMAARPWGTWNPEPGDALAAQEENSPGTKISAVRAMEIPLLLEERDRGMGGIVAAELDGDDKRDLLVTGEGYIHACAGSGKILWSNNTDIRVTRKSEYNGLPGSHGPGIQAGDIDGDGKTEVLFLTRDNRLLILDGGSGVTRIGVTLGKFGDGAGWEHLVLANFRGRGGRDLLLQATVGRGYRMGFPVRAVSLEKILETGRIAEILWERNDFLPAAHSGARVADLDGDGRDEVLGGTIVGPDGRVLYRLPVEGHIDAVSVADVRPDLPGLEVVALEEGGGVRVRERGTATRIVNRAAERLIGGGNHVFLYNHKGVIWKSHYRHLEAQNVAVGDFIPERPGREIWLRSRFNIRQKPFLLDARGAFVRGYEMEKTAPSGWTKKGVEEISTIHWTGGKKRLAVAKARHAAGDVVIFDPMGGKFHLIIEENARRLYVADLIGDFREEIIVLHPEGLRVYMNPHVPWESLQKSLWEENSYLRSKMTWNYYNP